MAFLDTRDPVAVAAVAAIHSGDMEGLRQLLVEHPGLATDRLGSATGMSRTLLHVAPDWPGHFPRGAETVAALVQAGADVNARFAGPHIETPLHWAASTDDVAVLDALLDAGADIEAGGSVIGGGTPMSDACAFAQWNSARRLLERGATTLLWEAAALGLMDRIEGAFAAEPAPDAHEVTQGLWAACHGGQREAAAYFLGRGADADWIGYDDLTPLDAADRAGASDLVAWLRARGARSARDLR
ncbi:ankyrin repeat domain-containing protein [Jiangella alkaliphila]|uniref:ankyrin repeat domain-containing protein n=1 Tax=Jiangella alkaliphila TaxID=419479 RepID=UPI000629A666|nr:ankyrin repeat domain-containing protein [Jiangella alkaliphila]